MNDIANDPVSNLPKSHRIVYSLIRSDRRISVLEISLITGFRSYKVRAIVADLVTLYHLPIGSSVKPGQTGFFIITNRESLEESVSHLQSRISRISQRVSVLRSIKDFGQAICSDEDLKINGTQQLSLFEGDPK